MVGVAFIERGPGPSDQGEGVCVACAERMHCAVSVLTRLRG